MCSARAAMSLMLSQVKAASEKESLPLEPDDAECHSEISRGWGKNVVILIIVFIPTSRDDLSEFVWQRKRTCSDVQTEVAGMQRARFPRQERELQGIRQSDCMIHRR